MSCVTAANFFFLDIRKDLFISVKQGTRESMLGSAIVLEFLFLLRKLAPVLFQIFPPARRDEEL